MPPSLLGGTTGLGGRAERMVRRMRINVDFALTIVGLVCLALEKHFDWETLPEQNSGLRSRDLLERLGRAEAAINRAISDIATVRTELASRR